MKYLIKYPRKHLFYGILAIFLLSGCKGCEDDLLANLNNGNEDPKVLIVETWGTEIRNALADELNGGFDCLGTANFTARVNIQVRTASYVNGNVVIDPTAYYDQLFRLVIIQAQIMALSIQ